MESEKGGDVILEAAVYPVILKNGECNYGYKILITSCDGAWLNGFRGIKHIDSKLILHQLLDTLNIFLFSVNEDKSTVITRVSKR